MTHGTFERGQEHTTLSRMKFCRKHALYYGGLCPECHPERPEDPIDEVIEITEEAWENNDLYISGDRRNNG